MKKNNLSNNLLPKSSRHMNSAEAIFIISFCLSRACRFFRQDFGGKSVFEFREEICQEVGHEIGFIVSNDELFPKFMKYFGAMYWLRCFKQCEEAGAEQAPLKESILPVGLFLKPDQPREYCILADPYFVFNSPDLAIEQNNCNLIDEMNKSHNLVGLLVEGYMWAQGFENQVGGEYRKGGYMTAAEYLHNEALAQFGLTMDLLRVMH